MAADNRESKINKEWLAQSLGSLNLTGEEKIVDASMEEETVILLCGKNFFNDDIYSYLKLTFRNFNNMRESMMSGQNITPSDFGEVLAAGTGYPPQNIIDEMRVKYKMVDLPKPKLEDIVPKGFTQPKFFDDYDL
jgi:hypothetical protein